MLLFTVRHGHYSRPLLEVFDGVIDRLRARGVGLSYAVLEFVLTSALIQLTHMVVLIKFAQLVY
jgi:hypothetical protein